MVRFQMIRISLLLLLASATLYSQGVNDALRFSEQGIGYSTRALGMGNAYIGLSDDATGMHNNPAGIGLAKRMEFTGGLSYTNMSNASTFFGNTTNYDNSSTKLNNLSFLLPFPTVRGSLVFGMTYNVEKDFNRGMKFDGYNPGNNSFIQNALGVDDAYDLFLTDDDGNTKINGRLNQSGSILESGTVSKWGFSGAIEAYPNLFLGATLNIMNSSYENSREYFEDDLLGIYDTMELAPGYPFTRQFRYFAYSPVYKWDIGGWNMKAGALYQIKDFARVGITIQFPKVFSINEKFEYSASSHFGDGTVKNVGNSGDPSEVEYDIITPFELSAGASYRFYGLILSGQVTAVDYKQTKFSNPEGLSEKDIADINRDIKDQLRAVINYNIGAEYTIPQVGVRVRAGYFVQKSPYQGDDSSFDKKYITGGIGLLLDDNVSIDLAYARGEWNDIGDNYGSGVSRTLQKIKTDNLLLGVGFRF